MKPRIQPSLWWLIPAPVIFAAGVGGGLFWLLSATTRPPVEAISFEAPGARTFTIAHPGTYVLWMESAPPALSDRLTRPTDEPVGKPRFVLRNADSLGEIQSGRTLAIRRLSGSRTLVALARWDIPAAGDYELQISGLTKPAAFAFGPSGMGALALTVVGAALASLLGWAGSFSITLIVLARRTRFRRLHARELSAASSASAPAGPA